ncbi:uncharacterized protein EURHEDRAFT_222326 [Aspergillus ruber CBS 135680]|uniref:Uncharacterized protein n=1 Tax=Aspergillus ruber (strain CBS 135680) TaxID=1388766 RepID=A0A017SQ31_ASPRC|nr:uncharacterized protein EURHEDRAFT_222326 [Aspergillus ruber CBS 135680]EYE98734.1 hypothetical protein EURHEDRAFT_222326 [Aspergillus ruber CBS 135680]
MNHRGSLVATGQIQCSVILGSGEPKTLTVLRHDFHAKVLGIWGMKNENRNTTTSHWVMCILGEGAKKSKKTVDCTSHFRVQRSRLLRWQTRLECRRKPHLGTENEASRLYQKIKEVHNYPDRMFVWWPSCLQLHESMSPWYFLLKHQLPSSFTYIFNLLFLR